MNPLGVLQNVVRYVDFTFKTGSMKTRPSSWKDLFFRNVDHAAGS